MKRLLTLLFCSIFLCTGGAMAVDDRIAEMEEILGRSSTDSLENLITTAYPQEELISYVDYGGSDNFNTMLYYLNTKYPVECIRDFDNASLPYCVYRLQEGGYLFIFFHGYELKFADYMFVVKESLTQRDFRHIRPGDSLADVEKMDTGTALYNRLHPEQIRTLPLTLHMVEGGFMKITYETAETGDEAIAATEHNPQDYLVKTVEFIPDGQILFTVEWYDCDNNVYHILPQDYPSDLPRPEKSGGGLSASYWWVLLIVILLAAGSLGFFIHYHRKGKKPLPPVGEQDGGEQKDL